jgi:hypothetical protein
MCYDLCTTDKSFNNSTNTKNTPGLKHSKALSSPLNLKQVRETSNHSKRVMIKCARYCTKLRYICCASAVHVSSATLWATLNRGRSAETHCKGNSEIPHRCKPSHQTVSRERSVGKLIFQVAVILIYRWPERCTSNNNNKYY